VGLNATPLDGLRDRSVLVTGHTGFKGSWLTLWLRRLGARVTGLSLPAEPRSLFELANVRDALHAHHEVDVRDADAVADVVASCRPQFVLHLAAQSLVRASYEQPLETLATNAQGTANVLDALRRGAHGEQACSVVCVTTDKCYRNDERGAPMREDDPLGGHDPYSASKAMAEHVVHSYRASFFPPAQLERHGVRVASARAGNVLGGGDYAADRIVPDLVRAVAAGRPLRLRNPDSVRPWQHVLDPLHGYLRLALALAGERPERYCDAFNFGPDLDGCTTVRELVEAVGGALSPGFGVEVAADEGAVHEAKLLRLATERARDVLGWQSVWNFPNTTARTAAWYARHAADPSAAREACDADLEAFERDLASR